MAAAQSYEDRRLTVSKLTYDGDAKYPAVIGRILALPKVSRMVASNPEATLRKLRQGSIVEQISDADLSERRALWIGDGGMVIRHTT
jgi:hypothetical protein